MGKKKKEEAKERRADFEANQILIHKAFIELLKIHKRKPTLAEISRETGISITTVKKHVDELDKSELIGTADKKFRVLTDDVILSIYRRAMAGSAASQKLWMQVVEEWSERTETKHSGEITTNNAPPVIVKITK